MLFCHNLTDEQFEYRALEIKKYIIHRKLFRIIIRIFALKRKDGLWGGKPHGLP